MTSGVYCIQYKGRRWIGSATNLEKQMRKAESNLRNNHFPNKRLQSDYRRDGSNFKFILLEVCEPKELNIRRNYYIRLYDTSNPRKGYNTGKGRMEKRAKPKRCVRPVHIIKAGVTTNGRQIYKLSNGCRRHTASVDYDRLSSLADEYNKRGGF